MCTRRQDGRWPVRTSVDWEVLRSPPILPGTLAAGLEVIATLLTTWPQTRPVPHFRGKEEPFGLFVRA